MVLCRLSIKAKAWERERTYVAISYPLIGANFHSVVRARPSLVVDHVLVRCTRPQDGSQPCNVCMAKSKVCPSRQLRSSTYSSHAACGCIVCRISARALRLEKGTRPNGSHSVSLQRRRSRMVKHGQGCLWVQPNIPVLMSIYPTGMCA